MVLVYSKDRENDRMCSASFNLSVHFRCQRVDLAEEAKSLFRLRLLQTSAGTAAHLGRHLTPSFGKTLDTVHSNPVTKKTMVFSPASGERQLCVRRRTDGGVHAWRCESCVSAYAAGVMNAATRIPSHQQQGPMIRPSFLIPAYAFSSPKSSHVSHLPPSPAPPTSTSTA